MYLNFALIGLITVYILLAFVFVFCITYESRHRRSLRRQQDEAWRLLEENRSEAGEARERGEQLLFRLLSPEQQQQYKLTGWITVPVANGYQATIGNTISGVSWRTPLGRTHHQCVFVVGSLVHVDDTIGKLLALRTDPQSVAWISGLDITGRDHDLGFVTR